MTLRWQQVSDIEGFPAWYRVKYAEPDIDYKTATIGCDPSIEGTEILADMTCTIEGLEPGTTYDVLLMSYRLEDGAWVGARYSNLVTGATSAVAGGPER
jgi:hypothetical protein